MLHHIRRKDEQKASWALHERRKKTRLDIHFHHSWFPAIINFEYKDCRIRLKEKNENKKLHGRFPFWIFLNHKWRKVIRINPGIDYDAIYPRKMIFIDNILIYVLSARSIIYYKMSSQSADKHYLYKVKGTSWML